MSMDHHPLCGAVGLSIGVLAWPLLSVSGTDLGALVAPFSEGAAVGLLNAALVLATLLGVVLSGPWVAHWGYATIPAMALAGLAASLACLIYRRNALGHTGN
jgi:predicted MFS family arabinose efflux permease